MTRSWLAFAVAIVIALAAARCDKNVVLGVAPDADGATVDAGDAGASD